MLSYKGFHFFPLYGSLALYMHFSDFVLFMYVYVIHVCGGCYHMAELGLQEVITAYLL